MCDADYVTVSAVKDALPDDFDLSAIRKAIARIKREMLDAAKDLKFEEAAALRDKMLDLQALELKYL